MARLTRWDPYREMMTLRGAVDQLMEDSYRGRAGGMESTYEWDLPLDVTETPEEFMVKASIPGVKPEDLEITFNNSMLTIRGEIKEEEEIRNSQYHLRERRFGTFSRSITLPSTIKSDTIEANYEDGVLTLRLPKSEEVKPRRIEINTGRMIENKVSSKK